MRPPPRCRFAQPPHLPRHSSRSSYIVSQHRKRKLSRCPQRKHVPGPDASAVWRQPALLQPSHPHRRLLGGEMSAPGLVSSWLTCR